jgi:hypothetical protein
MLCVKQIQTHFKIFSEAEKKIAGVSINMSATVGIPIAADFNVDGQVSVEALPHESFVWTGAHFTVANATMDASVFNAAFDLSEGIADASASLIVTMDPSGALAFRNALTSSLFGGVDAANKSLKVFLEEYAKAELDTHLADNNIPDAIEAEEVTDISLNNFLVDCSQGALNMWTNLVAAATTTPAKLNIIARQFPRARFQTAGEASLAMPGIAGDKITFRFNINQTYTSLNITEGLPTGVDGATVGDYPTNQSGTGYGVSAQAIDVVVELQ